MSVIRTRSERLARNIEEKLFLRKAKVSCDESKYEVSFSDKRQLDNFILILASFNLKKESNQNETVDLTLPEFTYLEYLLENNIYKDTLMSQTSYQDKRIQLNYHDNDKSVEIKVYNKNKSTNSDNPIPDEQVVFKLTPDENHFFDDKTGKELIESQITQLSKEDHSSLKTLKINALVLLRDSTPETIMMNYQNVVSHSKVTSGVFSHRTADLLNDIQGMIRDSNKPVSGYHLCVGFRFELTEMIEQLKKESNSFFSMNKGLKVEKIKALELVRDSVGLDSFNENMKAVLNNPMAMQGRHSRTKMALIELVKYYDLMKKHNKSGKDEESTVSDSNLNSLNG